MREMAESCGKSKVHNRSAIYTKNAKVFSYANTLTDPTNYVGFFCCHEIVVTVAINIQYLHAIYLFCKSIHINYLSSHMFT